MTYFIQWQGSDGVWRLTFFHPPMNFTDAVRQIQTFRKTRHRILRRIVDQNGNVIPLP